MANQTLKNTNVNELPTTGDIARDDYLIVHNSEITSRIKFKDVFISKENTTFGQEINDLYEKLEGLQKIVNNMPTNDTTYKKEELDSKLETKADAGNVVSPGTLAKDYMTTDLINTKIQSRAMKVDVYTKAEVDAKIDAVRSSVQSLEQTIDALDKKLDTTTKPLIDLVEDKIADGNVSRTVSWNNIVDVPASITGDYNDLLNKPTSSVIPTVSNTTAGLMTPEYKAKLDSIDSGSGSLKASVQKYTSGFKTSSGWDRNGLSGLSVDNIHFGGNSSNPTITWTMSKSGKQYYFEFREYGATFRQTK